MSSERPNQTVADFVALLVSPLLLMGLVGSLVFFLLEVFYHSEGEYKGRLQWILFFYVFGIVLTARISMRGDIGGRSALYALVLAFLTYLGMQLFVQYPPGLKDASWLVNLFLVGVVWWCAHRLTWDCTNVDEDADMSGEGLLQAAGLEERPGQDEAKEDEEEGQKGKKKPTWWERYRKYDDDRKKKRTLGVWVVYFSLAALPLFGLGQSLIPVADEGRRRFAFWLMTVYVACGLGLLLSTCYLGLRRYLRQRRLKMPAAMTGVWLGLGGGLVLALLALGALLPRPQSETPLIEVGELAGTPRREASRVAFKGGDAGEGEGQPGAQGKDGKEPGGQGGKKGEGGDGKEKGEKGSGKGDSGEGGSGKGKDGKGGSEKGESGKGESSKGEAGKGDPGKGEKGEKGEKGDPGKGGEKGEAGGQGDKKGSRLGNQFEKMGEKGHKGDKDNARSSSSQPSPSRAPVMSRVSDLLRRVAPVLKWVVFAALAVVVLLFVLKAGLQFLANFTDWAKRLLDAWKNFWANLFKPKEAAKDAGGEGGEAGPEAEPEQPFSDFRNPFDGDPSRWTARRLVRYTFAALQAWARERDLGRQPGETPLEFAARLGGEAPGLEADVRRLAALYARAVYAPGGMPANTADAVRAVWEKLEGVGAGSLMA